MLFPSSSKYWPSQVAKLGFLVVGLSLAMVGISYADDKPAVSRTIAEQFIHEMQEGNISASGADDHVVQELIIKRNIPITYKYFNTLMSTPNAFGPGVACAVCHNSNDPGKS